MSMSLHKHVLMLERNAPFVMVLALVVANTRVAMFALNLGVSGMVRHVPPIVHMATLRIVALLLILTLVQRLILLTSSPFTTS